MEETVVVFDTNLHQTDNFFSNLGMLNESEHDMRDSKLLLLVIKKNHTPAMLDLPLPTFYFLTSKRL
jgi:hypothetical protein